MREFQILTFDTTIRARRLSLLHTHNFEGALTFHSALSAQRSLGCVKDRVARGSIPSNPSPEA